VAPAAVYHLHDESWTQVRRRFEREAIALQHIMPEVHLTRLDVLRYFVSAVALDLRAAWQAGAWRRHATSIVAYRYHQFTGAYRGNHVHRRLSRAAKEAYFYPRPADSTSNHSQDHEEHSRDDQHVKEADRRPAAHEGQQ